MLQKIKQLREETGAGISACREVLDEARGDLKKAKELLKKKGYETAEKKAQRKTEAGLIESYTHFDGKVGVLLEVGCETDFVAKNPEFKTLVHDLCLQIASQDPKNEKELLSQPFIKDETKTVKDLLTEKISKIGENIKIKRFERWKLGE